MEAVKIYAYYFPIANHLKLHFVICHTLRGFKIKQCLGVGGGNVGSLSKIACWCYLSRDLNLITKTQQWGTLQMAKIEAKQ